MLNAGKIFEGVQKILEFTYRIAQKMGILTTGAHPISPTNIIHH
jgi:hypothetical protein